MPQASFWILEFPLSFLGEMVGEINRKNIDTTSARRHDSLPGPSQPLSPPRQGPRGSAACSLLRRSEILGASCLWGWLSGRLGLAPPPPAPT